MFNSGGGEVNHPVRGRPMPAKFLGGTATRTSPGKDRRVVLANWLASAENPYFAKNLSNIVWDHFFGQGIVNEVDDVRISNPASNQELLDELGQEVHRRTSTTSRSWCATSARRRRTSAARSRRRRTRADTRNFARGPIRRIRAETMLDIITQVTDTKNKFQGLPLGARAVQIADGGVSTYFLTTFGRPTRETVCSCEVRLEPTLSQSLHLLNGGTVEPKIAQGNIVGKMLQEKKTPAQIIEHLYIRCLTRAPKPDEMKKLLAMVDEGPGQEAGARRRVLGDHELPRVHVQPLTRRHTRCRFLSRPGSPRLRPRRHARRGRPARVVRRRTGSRPRSRRRRPRRSRRSRSSGAAAWAAATRTTPSGSAPSSPSATWTPAARRRRRSSSAARRSTPTSARCWKPRRTSRSSSTRTPDHWHTLVNLAALKAGKDVYSEKPLTLTIDEGKRVVAAVKEHKRVLQTGSQQRSDARFRLACEIVRNGRLGKLTTVTTVLPQGLNAGPFKTAPVPKGLDWDAWQGPTAETEYVPERCHFSFRYWTEYSGGTLTDWGAHHNDIALWAIGARERRPGVASRGSCC